MPPLVSSSILRVNGATTKRGRKKGKRRTKSDNQFSLPDPFENVAAKKIAFYDPFWGWGKEC